MLKNHTRAQAGFLRQDGDYDRRDRRSSAGPQARKLFAQGGAYDELHRIEQLGRVRQY